MKVLMCNSYYHMRGGAERCFFGLSALLSAHGHEVIPFSMQHEQNLPTEFSRFFVSNVDFPTELAKNGSLAKRLRVVERVIFFREAGEKIERLVAETKPDVAHVHGIAHEISPSILPAIKRAGIPIVQTLHDYKLLCPNTSFLSNGRLCERCKQRRYYNVVLHKCKRASLSASLLACVEMYCHKMFQLYERNVDLFVAPSRFLQEKLAEYRIENPVVHLPNFVNSEALEPSYGSEGYFLYFGRLSAEKGVRTLLEAIRYLGSARLLIAGTGDLEDSLRQYASENRLSGVTFLGHLCTQDLHRLVQGAAFTVLPSEWYENYPMSVLESFACGTPVIGSNIGGIPELLRDGWNGLLFEPGNAQQLAQKIRFLLDNPGQAMDMGRNGRRQVESDNTPEQHYRATIAVYERQLGENRAVRPAPSQSHELDHETSVQTGQERA